MKCPSRLIGLVAILFAAVAFVSLAEENRLAAQEAAEAAPEGDTTATAMPPPAESPAATPAKHTVTAGPFQVEVKLDGVFEAAQMVGVVLRPEVWAELVVKEAVEQGAAVKQGENLVVFETNKINEAIRDLEAERKLADLAVEQLQNELRLLEQTTPLDLAAAERANNIASADLRRFLETDRAFSIKSAEFSLKSSADMLAYSREELNQLEKMYKADDLTEETEEIILKRTRDDVERSEFQHEMAKVAHEQSLKIQLPRQEETLKEAAARQSLALQKAQISLPMALNKARLDLEKLKFDQTKATEKLARYKRDAELLTVRSPADGLAYFGACVRGEWAAAATVAPRLQPGGAIAAGEVFLTIVRARPLVVRATIPEKELHRLAAGQIAQIAAAAFPDLALRGTIDSVSAVPNAAGKFNAMLRLDLPGEPSTTAPPVPGMTCQVTIKTYSNEQALTVPAKAVFADDADPAKRYVYVVGKDDQNARRDVTVGRRSDDKVEVTAGLSAGDIVLLGKPPVKP